MEILELAAILGIITDVVIIYFIYRTLNQNSKQFFEIHQPMIDLKIKETDDHGNCIFIIKNFGNMIAENINIKCKDKLPKGESSELKNINYLLPTQEQTFGFNIVDQYAEDMADSYEGYDHVDSEIEISYTVKNKNKKFVYNVEVGGTKKVEAMQRVLLLKHE